MRIERMSSPSAAQVRALWPAPPDVEADVRAIVDQDEAAGETRFGHRLQRDDGILS